MQEAKGQPTLDFSLSDSLELETVFLKAGGQSKRKQLSPGSIQGRNKFKVNLEENMIIRQLDALRANSVEITMIIRQRSGAQGWENNKIHTEIQFNNGLNVQKREIFFNGQAVSK